MSKKDSIDLYRISDGTIFFSSGVILVLIGFMMIELYAVLETTYTSREIEQVFFLSGYGFLFITFGILFIIFGGIMTGYGYGTNVCI